MRDFFHIPKTQFCCQQMIASTFSFLFFFLNFYFIASVTKFNSFKDFFFYEFHKETLINQLHLICENALCPLNTIQIVYRDIPMGTILR